MTNKSAEDDNDTSVEEWNLSGVWFPKVLSLVKTPLRCASLLDVWVFWIRHDD